MIRTYEELMHFETYEERFRYLKLDGTVGMGTFGHDRYLNQRFYHSREWYRIRDAVIARDLGCDMALEGYEIFGKICIHHMNPMMAEDIRFGREAILNPEYLLCMSLDTHNAIHYGEEPPQQEPIVRSANDTCPWKRGGRDER